MTTNKKNTGKKVVKRKAKKVNPLKPFAEFITFQPRIDAETAIVRGLQIAAYNKYKRLIDEGLTEEEALLQSDLSSHVQKLHGLVDSDDEKIQLKAIDTILKYTTGEGTTTEPVEIVIVEEGEHETKGN